MLCDIFARPAVESPRGHEPSRVLLPPLCSPSPVLLLATVTGKSTVITALRIVKNAELCAKSAETEFPVNDCMQHS